LAAHLCPDRRVQKNNITLRQQLKGSLRVFVVVIPDLLMSYGLKVLMS